MSILPPSKSNPMDSAISWLSVFCASMGNGPSSLRAGLAFDLWTARRAVSMMWGLKVSKISAMSLVFAPRS